MRKSTGKRNNKEAMDNKKKEEFREFRKFLDTPGVKNALSRTISNADHPFNDKRDYPQSRVNAVSRACIEALRKN